MRRIALVAAVGLGALPGGASAAPSASVTEIRAFTQPAALAAAGGRVWVFDRGGFLAPVDARTAVVGRTVPAPGDPRAYGLVVTMAAGAGAVWLLDGGQRVVFRLDPATGRARGRAVRLADVPVAVAAGGTTLWVGDAAGRVLRYAADTGRGLGRPLPPSGSPGGPPVVAAAAGAAWVVEPRGRLVRVDAATGRVTRRIQLPGGRQGRALASAGSRLWVGAFQDRTLRALDPRTLRPLGPAVGLPLRPAALAVDPDGVWVAGPGGEVLRTTAAGRPRGTPVAAGEADTDLAGLVAAGGSGWLADAYRGRIARLVPAP